MPGGKTAVRLERAFIDLTLLLAIGYLGYGVATTAVAAAQRDARLELVAREAHALYDGFAAYRERNGAFPEDVGSDPAAGALDQLLRRGYYKGRLTRLLVGQRLDGYEAPDDGGANTEFWVEMSLAADPGIRVLVARSDDAPLGRGRWLDGVFLYRGGALEPI